MRARVFISVLVLLSVVTTSYSQEKTSKELKKQNRVEKQKTIEALVNSKEFVFVPQTAIPSGMKMINQSSGLYYVKFQSKLIDSYLPFFGYSNSGIGYGTDTGLSFKGEPEVFNVEKNEKGYYINTSVKSENDIFTISLTIGFRGNASLIISSNKRSTISYNGMITSNYSAL